MPSRESGSPIFSRQRKRSLYFFGQILLVCLPQAAIDIAAIVKYAGAGIFPPFGIGTHVFLLLTFHVLFFSGWALLSRRVRGADKAWFRRLYAIACFARGLMINPVYLASYVSYGLWGEYTTWANLKAARAHLRGFQLAFGGEFFAGLALVGAALLAYFWLTLKTARLSLRWLHSTYAGPAAAPRGLLLTALCATISTGFLFRDPLWDQMAERDPILAFWMNRAASEPVLTPAMLADRAAGQSYQAPEKFRRRNVLVIAIDCLRADHLSFRGYERDTTPFLTSLHRSGKLAMVDQAVSNGNDSAQGIRTLLCSRIPHRHNIHNFRLHDLLKRAGYRTYVFGTGDHTTLGNMRKYYGPNVDVFQDGLSSADHSVNDDRGVLEAVGRLGPASAQPAFFYIHLMSAHELGVRLPTFARWHPSTLTTDWHPSGDDETRRRQIANTYDNGVLQADHYLREILHQLEAKGYLKDYIIVITGDHGQGLGEHGHYSHARHLHAEDVNVPILFFDSDGADFGPMPFASHVDIAPTILDRLGLSQPQRWQGQSLYHAPPPSLAYLVGTHKEGWKGIIFRHDGATHKYLIKGTRQRSFQELLYDVKLDPGETNNLAGDPSKAALLSELRRMAAREFERPLPPSD